MCLDLFSFDVGSQIEIRLFWVSSSSFFCETHWCIISAFPLFTCNLTTAFFEKGRFVDILDIVISFFTKDVRLEPCVFTVDLGK